jgi:hypothetical protein
MTLSVSPSRSPQPQGFHPWRTPQIHSYIRFCNILRIYEGLKIISRNIDCEPRKFLIKFPVNHHTSNTVSLNSRTSVTHSLHQFSSYITSIKFFTEHFASSTPPSLNIYLLPCSIYWILIFPGCTFCFHFSHHISSMAQFPGIQVPPTTFMIYHSHTVCLSLLPRPSLSHSVLHWAEEHHGQTS